MRLLFELAQHPEGLTVTELARRLGTQRPPLYRQLRTLLDARLIRRTEGKLYRLGVGVLELARAFSDPLLERARPLLQSAADATGYSAMLNVAEGDALVLVWCATPRAPGMHLTTPIGFLYPDGLIPPRVAMMASRPRDAEEPLVVTEARERGYVGTATIGSRYGFVGVAVPLRSRGAFGSLALARGVGPLDEADERSLAQVAQAAAREITDSSL
ncbi:transcriptional regulator [Microbacterium album]|uniref:Transcriptional regulator n=1 Tax=Microbacterium album TaxID=2053191 RepID=A0A917IFR6_9MICO|nr:transcriptional regulator [Microbacterium album]